LNATKCAVVVGRFTLLEISVFVYEIIIATGGFHSQISQGFCQWNVFHVTLENEFSLNNRNNKRFFPLSSSCVQFECDIARDKIDEQLIRKLELNF
jgi:hypothetical protein